MATRIEIVFGDKDDDIPLHWTTKVSIDGEDVLVTGIDLRLALLHIGAGFTQTIEHRHWHCSVRKAWWVRLRQYLRGLALEITGWYRARQRQRL